MGSGGACAELTGAFAPVDCGLGLIVGGLPDRLIGLIFVVPLVGGSSCLLNLLTILLTLPVVKSVVLLLSPGGGELLCVAVGFGRIRGLALASGLRHEGKEGPSEASWTDIVVGAGVVLQWFISFSLDQSEVRL